MSPVPECLCLGPKDSGKTLLMMKLAGESVDETTSSESSRVVDWHVRTKGDKKDRNAKKTTTTTTIRELGGDLAPRWHRYYDQTVKKVIFVVDAANLCQISEAGVLLYAALAHESLKAAKFLLALSKMDVSYRQMKNEALFILQYDKLTKQIPCNVECAEFSAVNGTGIDGILRWLGKED